MTARMSLWEFEKLLKPKAWSMAFKKKISSLRGHVISSISTLYQVKFRVRKSVPSANPPYNQYHLLSGRFISGLYSTSSLPPSKARSETGAKRREVSRWEVQIAFMAKRYAIKSAVQVGGPSLSSSCAVGQGIRVIKRAKLSVHKSVLLRYGLGGRTDGRRMASNARTTTRAQSEAHTALYPVTIKQARVSVEHSAT